MKSNPVVIGAAREAIAAPNRLTRKEFTMKRHSLPPGARAFVAFIGAVVLALLAAVLLLLPDVAVQSADSMPHGLTGLDQILSSSFLRH